MSTIERPHKSMESEYVPLKNRFSTEKLSNNENKQDNGEPESTLDRKNKLLSHIKESDPKIASEARSVIESTLDKEEQVSKLTDIALQKGVDHAVKIAMKMDDLFVLDQLHDQLVATDFQNELRKKGILKD